MTYRLSLLDKSPLAPAASLTPAASAAAALATTLEAARRADALGFHRFWLAEHHGTQALASAAPEVLIAHILAQTQKIRLGSGGVLLQHYASFKVAEIFAVLASLAPGRVDLGIGKSPGGLPLATRALRGAQPPHSPGDLARKLADLEAWLNGPHQGAEIQPRPAQLPERFLLGASIDSAEQAARLGWGFVYAGHQDGDKATTRQVLRTYQDQAGRPAILAVAAFAAPSRAEAEDRLGALRIVRPVFADGHAVNLTSEAAAHDYARQYGSSDYRIEYRQPTALVGTGADIREQLAALQAEFGLREFIIDQPIADPAARLDSIALIATGARRLAA